MKASVIIKKIFVFYITEDYPTLLFIKIKHKKSNQA